MRREDAVRVAADEKAFVRIARKLSWRRFHSVYPEPRSQRRALNELTADGLGWCVVVVVHILDMAAWSINAAAADAAVRGGVVDDG